MDSGLRRHLDNLDEVPIRGKVKFRAGRDEFYGGAASRDYESPVLEDPTWLDLCVHANRMILTTGDEHHCFLEGFAPGRSFTFATGSPGSTPSA
jgi:hypothetical protein